MTLEPWFSSKKLIVFGYANKTYKVGAFEVDIYILISIVSWLVVLWNRGEDTNFITFEYNSNLISPSYLYFYNKNNKLYNNIVIG